MRALSRGRRVAPTPVEPIPVTPFSADAVARLQTTNVYAAIVRGLSGRTGAHIPYGEPASRDVRTETNLPDYTWPALGVASIDVRKNLHPGDNRALPAAQQTVASQLVAPNPLVELLRGM